MRKEHQWSAQRDVMVKRDLAGRGISDARVLRAMRSVARHEFVPDPYKPYAYDDRPLPIGEDQTISQPYIVALMTEALSLHGGERVLEIGTGSGYQAAVLAELGARVWTVDRSETLSCRAQHTLKRLGYRAIRFCIGDGTQGWLFEAPFERILATGSLPDMPRHLLAQLVSDGIFVGPIGTRDNQDLVRVIHGRDDGRRDTLGACRFVPLVGQRGWAEEHRPEQQRKEGV